VTSVVSTKRSACWVAVHMQRSICFATGTASFARTCCTPVTAYVIGGPFFHTRRSDAGAHAALFRQTKQFFVLKTCCKLDALSYSHLRTEAQLMHGVSHPFLITPLAISNPPGRSTHFSLLLPLCPGGDFLQLLRRQAGCQLSTSDARTYFCMIALGLQALHDLGLVYRDLKPDNLLVQANGYLALADFGFVVPAAECTRSRAGTAEYQAPELLRAERHGAAVDWWALGVLLFEMVVGKQPFTGSEAEVQEAVLAHTHGLPQRCAAQEEALLGDAAPIVRALLIAEARERLGAVEAGGVSALRGHPWLASVDWEQLLEMKVSAPMVPSELSADADAALAELTQRCQSGFDF